MKFPLILDDTTFPFERMIYSSRFCVFESKFIDLEILKEIDYPIWNIKIYFRLDNQFPFLYFGLKCAFEFLFLCWILSSNPVLLKILAYMYIQYYLFLLSLKILFLEWFIWYKNIIWSNLFLSWNTSMNLKFFWWDLLRIPAFMLNVMVNIL